MRKALAFCITAAITVFFVFGNVLENGLVLSIIWNWFMPPLFGIRTLTWNEALAVGLVIAFLTHQTPQTNSNRSDQDKFMDFVWLYVSPLVTLLVALILREFVF